VRHYVLIVGGGDGSGGCNSHSNEQQRYSSRFVRFVYLYIEYPILHRPACLFRLVVAKLHLQSQKQKVFTELDKDRHHGI
jgi:hypothetical protein